MGSWLDRVARAVLGWAGGGDAAEERDRLWWLRVLVLVHGSFRTAYWWIHSATLPAAAVGGLDRGVLALTGAGLVAALALALPARTARLAPWPALAALAVQLAMTFPTTDNHFFLELWCVGMLAALPPERTGDRDLAIRALQWTGAIVLFHTGLQKLWLGMYDRGEFLAFMIATSDRFAAPFGLLIGPAEVERLRDLLPIAEGAGPFRVDSLLFVAASNAVWILELTIPPLLIWRRTRTLAAVAATGLVAAVQTGARELTFLLLFANLMLLYPPGVVARRVWPLFVLVYVWLLGVRLGLLPGAPLLVPGHL